MSRKNLRGLLAMLLAGALLAGAAGCGDSDAPQTQGGGAETPAAGSPLGENEVRIGFYGPLTGATSLAGQASKNGAQLAVDELNTAGGIAGTPVRLIAYDDKSSPEQAVKNVTKLIDSDQVHGIVASLHSGNILAAAPIIEEGKTPAVGLGTSPEWQQKGYTYLFRALASNDYGNIGICDFIKKLGYTKVGILYRAEDYAKFNAEDIAEKLAAQSIEVVATESFPAKDTDYTAQITNILNKEPQTIISYAGSENLGIILKQLRQKGYDGYLFGDQSLTMPDIREVAGAAADGAIFSANYIIPDSPEGAGNEIEKAFCESYMETFGEMPASDNAYRAYDAVKILARGVEDAGTLEGEAVRDAIENITDLNGIAGTFNFKGNHGEGIDAVRNYMIRDNRIVLIDDALEQEILNNK